MATYTLTHSSIACLMTATSDLNTLAEYRMADPAARHYLGTRACRAWSAK